jgi:hypothetical protein
VKDCPKPRTTREFREFLGLAVYYRVFIPNFSKIAKPLTGLLKKNTAYIWNDKTEVAYVTLKTVLTTEPSLHFSDFTRTFVLTTDASNNAIESVLSQGPIGKDLPIVYASRTLNNAAINCPTVEKELLFIVWEVNTSANTFMVECLP